MKSLLTAVLSAFVFIPLSVSALSGLYPPGSSPGNPIYVEIEEPYTSPLRFDTDKALQNSPYEQQKRQDAMINGHLPSNLQQPQVQAQGCPIGYVPVGNTCMPYSSINTRAAQTPMPTLDQRCKQAYGAFSVAQGSGCSCIANYEWASDRKSCVPQSNGITIITKLNAASGETEIVGGHYTPPSERKKPDVAPQPAPKAVGMPVCNKDFSNAPCTTAPVDPLADITNWKVNDTATSSAASSSPQIATGIFSVFSLLVLMGGILRLLT